MNEMLPKPSFDQPNTLRGSLPDTADVGNFFAPFFDVVFYKPSTESGNIVDDGTLAEGEAGGTPEARRAFEGARTSSQVESSQQIGGSTIRLRTTSGKVQLFEADAALSDLKNYRSNLTIDVRAAAAYRATLVLQPPYEDAVKLIDAEAIKFGSIMEIQWGYLNLEGGEPILSDKGLFSIVQPSISFGQQITIKISGWDFLSASGSSLDYRCSWPREQYPTDADVLAKLLNRVSSSMKLDCSLLRSVGTSPLLQKKSGQRLIQTTNNITFFQRLVRQNNATYTIKEDKVVLQDQDVADRAEATYRLLWYRELKDKRDIPMISFESNSIPSLFAANGSRGYFTISHNLDDDETTEEQQDPEEQGGGAGNNPHAAGSEEGHTGATSTTAAGQAKPYEKNVDEGVCASGKVWMVPDEKANQAEERKNKARENMRMANTRANVTIPGHPSILPMTIVSVDGVGKKFGGTYRVLKLTHEIGTGGYITKLDLLRASSSANPNSTDPVRSGPANNSVEVDPAAGSTVAPIVLDLLGNDTAVGEGTVLRSEPC